MKTFDKCAAQGDVYFIKIDGGVPDGYGQIKEIDGSHIIAHSETGHHHTISAASINLYRRGDDEYVSYMEMLGDQAEVIHHRAYDTHTTIKALGKKGDVFKIIRQREYTPKGLRRVED